MRERIAGWLTRGQESVGNGLVASTDVDGMLRLLGAEGDNVSIETGLSIPPLWCAVHFISQTLARLPLNVYLENEVHEDHVNKLLSMSPCPGQSSYQVREDFWRDYLTEGVAYLYIERDRQRRPVNLWPVEVSTVNARRVDGRIQYTIVNGSNGSNTTVDELDMVRLAWSLEPDRVGHRSPIIHHKHSLARARYLNEYAALNFAGGGLPPYIVQGPLGSPDATKRMTTEVTQTIKDAIGKKRRVMALPAGYQIEPLAQSARDNQLVEQDKLMTIKVAQIYMLPPVFLQDLTQGTFNNTEQQDLAYAKHTVASLAEKFEQELLLKLYGRLLRRKIAVRHNMDDLLRGDYTTRTRGHALSIQTGQLTPNEARALEDRPSETDGDDLLVQGALMKISDLGKEPEPEGDDEGGLQDDPIDDDSEGDDGDGVGTGEPDED